MSEPITRRRILTDYRIRVAKCEQCGKQYFPPKSFCDVEGRHSKISHIEYFNDKGTIVSANIVRRPTNNFRYLDSLLTAVIAFDQGQIKIPGRITDYTPSNQEVDVTRFIDREVVPRFRRMFCDGESGQIYYSSLAFSFTDDYYSYQNYVIETPSNEELGKPGIVGYGVYIPKYRIKNTPDSGTGVEERTLPFADEDMVTFAVEAAKRALIHSASPSKLVTKCVVGSESNPYSVKPATSIITQALELGERFNDGFFTGGTSTQFACKAATDEFIDAVSLVTNPVFTDGGERTVMVIGSDNSQAAKNDPLDYSVGAGAAAFLFGARDVIATLDAFVTYSSDTSDFWRRDGQKYPKHGGRFTGEPSYFKHVLTATRRLMEKTKLKTCDIDYVGFHSPNIKFPITVAEKMRFNPEQYETGLIARWIGNLYSGSCPTALAAILDLAKPDERILITSYGSGAGSDAYLFTITEKIKDKRERSIPVINQIQSEHREYVTYETYRKWKEIGS
ncbi:MAG: hydroxymethylglutaryl-CoA synthase [Candidatus Bathyarchaeota archaeon]|nr:MAG: hydroxymethylglutaryl-CoA synthase [Candidatus Bathyarchaeota archaeon]